MISSSRAVAVLAVAAFVANLITPTAAQVCAGQANGGGTCNSYRMSFMKGGKPACTGQCAFQDYRSSSGFPFCLITADSSKCSSGSKPTCTCVVNKGTNKVCSSCGVATPSSAEPLEFEMPDIGGACGTSFMELFSCIQQEENACKDFDIGDTAGMFTEQTSCDDAKDMICNSGLLKGCCDDKVMGVVGCLAKENHGLDCELECAPPSAGYKSLPTLPVAGMAGIAGVLAGSWAA